MQPQMQEMTTAATRDNPDEAIDHVAKPAASLHGNMVTRRSPTEAALAPPSAKPPPAEPVARCASDPLRRSACEARASREPGPAPVAPDDATPADREERPAGPVRTAVAGLRAMGSGLVPKPAAAGSRHGLRLHKWSTAVAIFAFAYLCFVAAILAGLNFMPDFLLTL